MQISIVNYSEVTNLIDCRIDAGYWHPAFISNSKLISPDITISHLVKDDVKNIKSSPINKSFEYLEISNISINDGDYQSTTVNQGEEPDRAHHILHKNDVVVSTVRPNRNAVALIKDEGIIGSSGLCVLRADGVNYKYLYIFCKTGYFIKCLVRANKATMYPAVSNNDVLNTPILILSQGLEKSIVDLIDNAFEMKKRSKVFYNHAQALLLTEVALANWQSKRHLAFVKSYSGIKHTGRIDAEYFQPRYDDIVNTIKNYSGGWDTLKNLVTLKDEVFHPCDKQKYRYIELADLTENGEIADYMFDEGQNLPSRARRKIFMGDVIVSSIEGSLSSIALVEDDNDQAICSTGFYVINSSKLNSETLLIALKSVVGQLQLKKGCSGTILTAINKEEFGKIVLPKVAGAKQTQIQQKVTEAFNLRKQSKHLLECAKRAVEIAIEKSEQAALQWLEEQTNHPE